MRGSPPTAWVRFRARSGYGTRWPPRGSAGVAFWLLVWFLVLTALRLLPGTLGTLCAVLEVLVGLVLLAVGIPVLWRPVRQRMLWSLRNRLVLLYLLVGLAPVVLLLTLVGISAYIAGGQFATHLTEIRLQGELEELDGWSAVPWDVVEREAREEVDRPGGLQAGVTALRWDGASASRYWTLRPRIQAFEGGIRVPLEGAPEQGRVPEGLPPWAMSLPGNHMHGIVLDNGELFLTAVRQETLRNGRRLSLVVSLPVDRGAMDRVAQDMGRAGLLGVVTETPFAGTRMTASRAKSSERTENEAGARGAPSKEQIRRSAVYGGAEPTKANWLDLRVRFLSTLPATLWDTGLGSDVPIEVVSRPSRLYKQLFGASLTGIVTRVLRVSLLVLCGLFALLEAGALWMAVRLSRTVTASVTDLYEATRRVDRGDLQHTIAVERDDQMAALVRSFNTMTGSLQRLLVEQKEKERMQNELSIAQEVQANLFPRVTFALPKLELYGVCRPARTVSGDYYDFLLFGDGGTGEVEAERTAGVGIAVGDISGKGISAALLMATLHSAVRAYRLASEDLLLAARRRDGGAGSDGASAAAAMFESPGEILSLLNRHLFRTTTPEKYATLFLAHYDARTARLTYSNGGQLPPLILRLDGSIRRLECGGTVVGLMDGMRYEQETVPMEPGDILVAYSDGVTEPENDFGDFGEERLMEVVQRYRDQPLAVITTQVLQALDAWIGAEEQPDDITLVLARQS